MLTESNNNGQEVTSRNNSETSSQPELNTDCKEITETDVKVEENVVRDSRTIRDELVEQDLKTDFENGENVVIDNMEQEYFTSPEYVLGLLRTLPNRLRFTPVGWNKNAYLPEWQKFPLTKEKIYEVYVKDRGCGAIGLMAGEASGGLVSVDEDAHPHHQGHSIKQFIEEKSGLPYEEALPPTVCFTSGKPNRKVSLYRVPEEYWSAIKSTDHVTLRGETKNGQREVLEQLQLMWNGKQNIIAGHHPETGYYRPVEGHAPHEIAFAEAPTWLLELMLPKTKNPKQTNETLNSVSGTWSNFLVNSVYQTLELESGFTWNGHNFHTEDTRGVVKGCCPWHESKSGTSFTVWRSEGIIHWMCAAGCGKGDLVGYRHRLNGGDGKPKGKDFTDIVKGLASEAGVDMPRIENKKIENRELSFEEAMKRTEEIIEELGDPALQMWELEKLASKCSKGITAAKLRQMHQIRVDNFREFNPKDVHEILATAPETREWLIADLISKATTIVLNADGGVGKTLLIYDLVKAIATGRRWNGFNTQKGKVLIIQTDEPEIDTAERLNIAHFGEEVETGYVKFETNWQFSQIKQLTKWVKQEVPSLVVIDSLTSCNRDTTYEEKDIAYARCLYELRDLANELGITFIVLHHTNKQGGARGTTGIRNNVSEVWNLRKGETKENLLPLQRVLQFDKSRSGCAGSIVLELNPDDYSWKYLNKVNEPQGGMAPYPARLLGFFNKNQGTKYDPEELVEIIPGATKDACRKTCERLWKRGHIKREERIKSFNGRNYRSFVYYTPNEYINSQNKGEQKEVLSSLELQQRNTNSFEAGQASGQEPDNLDKDELETLQQRNTNSFEAGQAKKEDVQIQNKTGNASLDLTSSAMSSSETVDIQGLQQNHQGNTDSVQMLSSSLSSSETVDIQEVEGASGQNVEKEDKRRFKCGGLSSISIGDDVTYIGEKLAQQFKEIRLVVLSVDEDRETARLKKTNGYETGDIPLKDLRLRMGF